MTRIKESKLSSSSEPYLKGPSIKSVALFFEKHLIWNKTRWNWLYRSW